MTAEYAIKTYPQVVDALKDEDKFMKTIAEELGVNVDIVRRVKRATFPNRKRNHYLQMGKGRKSFVCPDYYRTKYPDAIALLQVGTPIRKVGMITGLSHLLVFRLKKMFVGAEFHKSGGKTGPKYSGHVSNVYVEQYTMDGKFVARYSTMYEAEQKLGGRIQASSIWGACYGRNKTAGGYIWKTVDKNKNRDVKIQKFDRNGSLIETYANIEIATKKNLHLGKKGINPKFVRIHITRAIERNSIAYGFYWKTSK